MPTAKDWFAALPRIDRAITPEEAVALAQQHSPVIAAMQQDVAMAKEMLAMARARTAPMLATNVFGTYGDATMIVNSQPGVEPANSRMVQGGGSLDVNFMAMLPLYTGGALQDRIGAERHRSDATAADLRSMRIEMALSVLTMARRLVAMQAMLDVANEAAGTNEERLRIDRAAQVAGRLPLANVLRDESELAVTRQQCATAERDIRVMLADLKAMLGVHPLSKLTVAGGEQRPASATTVEVDLDTAVRQRPELAAVRSRTLAAGKDLDAAHAASLPTVGLFGMADIFASRMNDMDRYEEFTVGVGVSLPLLDGGMRAAQVRRARADKARLTAQETETALRIAREVSQAHDRLTTARLNVTTTAAALVSAREDYRLMQLRYQAGMAVNVEVLDALRMRTMAAANVVSALQEQALAEDELRRAVGDPTLQGPASVGKTGG